MSDALSNLPKLSEALAPDLIRQMIEAETEPLKKRRDELVGMCQRFGAAFPTIDNEEADQKAAEVLAVCARFITAKTGRVDAAREAFKKPVLDASNAIGSANNGPFAALSIAVETAMQPVKRASIAYKAEVARKEREKREAEAKFLEAQAKLAEKLAERRGTGMADAAQAAVEADAARKAANVSTADLTRTHGDAVGVSSLRYRRVAKIVNAALVPRQYCSPDMTLINAAKGKAQTEFPAIPGVEFIDEPDLTVGR